MNDTDQMPHIPAIGVRHQGVLLATHALNLGDHELALEVARGFSDRFLRANYMGSALLRLKGGAEARPLYVEALRHASDCASQAAALSNLAYSLFCEGQREPALETILASLAVHRGAAMPYIVAATIAGHLGDHAVVNSVADSAASAFKKSVLRKVLTVMKRDPECEPFCQSPAFSRLLAAAS